MMSTSCLFFNETPGSIITFELQKGWSRIGKGRSTPIGIMPKSKKQRNTNRPNTSRAVQRRVSAPIAQASMVRRKPPSMQSSNGGFRVKNSELITKLAPGNSTTSQIITKSINPGLGEVFPWLSQIASRYEKYRFHKLVFRYVARCPTTTAGDISMAVEFNTLQAPPADMQQMSSYKGFVNTPVWREVSLPVGVSDMNSSFKTHFVRQGTITGDRRLYDVGDLNVIMNAIFAQQSFQGYLYVDYDVEFMIPQLNRDNSTFFTQNVQATFPMGRVGSGHLQAMQTENQIVYTPLTTPDRALKNGIIRRRVRNPSYIGSIMSETYVYLLPKGRWSITGQSLVSAQIAALSGGWRGLEGVTGMLSLIGQTFPMNPLLGTAINLTASAVSAFHAAEKTDPTEIYGFGGAVDQVLTVDTELFDLSDSVYIENSEIQALQNNIISPFYLTTRRPTAWQGTGPWSLATFGLYFGSNTLVNTLGSESEMHVKPI